MKKKQVISLFSAAAVASGLCLPALAASGPFADVAEGAWYSEAVDYAVENGLFSGTGSTTFSPNASMTRGMFVTVLGRMSGLDGNTIQDNGQFSDVEFDAYYGPSVVWAYENGIISGTSDTTFSPDRPITREQIAVMVYRYLNTLDVQGPDGGETEPFQDADQISSYAVEAVNAMQSWGFITGSNGSYRPQDNVSRAEAATILMRVDYFLENGEPYQPVETTPDDGETDPSKAGFTVTTPSFEIQSSVYDEEGIRDMVCGTIKITDFEEGFQDMQYVDDYFSESVKYTFKSSDTSIIKVNEDGELYDPIRLENGAAPVTAYITVTKVGAGSVKVPVTISPSAVWYKVDDEYIAEFAEEVCRLTNEYRKAAGVQTVTLMTGAQDIANYRCELLAQEFSHAMPDGIDYPVYVDFNGNEIGFGRENIAKISVNYNNNAVDKTPESLAQSFVNTWYNSSNHRTTMLMYTLTRVGVGLHVDDNGVAYAVQFFTSIS